MNKTYMTALFIGGGYSTERRKRTSNACSLQTLKNWGSEVLKGGDTRG